MNAHAALLAIPEAPVRGVRPLFVVQPPDGRRDWAELDRQGELFRLMRMAAPTVFGFAIPNAGKRNPRKAKREGILGGAFDTEWHWSRGSAWVEMKGYDASGTAGRLSENQIDWGNQMQLLGKHVGCFFDPVAAVEWLRLQGAPVRDLRA